MTLEEFEFAVREAIPLPNLEHQSWGFSDLGSASPCYEAVYTTVDKRVVVVSYRRGMPNNAWSVMLTCQVGASKAVKVASSMYAQAYGPTIEICLEGAKAVAQARVEKMSDLLDDLQ